MFLGKNKPLFHGRKKYIFIGGTAALTIIGYVLYKGKKISFPDWLKIATVEELKEVYKEMWLEFQKTGFKPAGMEQISQELGIRDAVERRKNHPESINPNFRWTDANRWDRD